MIRNIIKKTKILEIKNAQKNITWTKNCPMCQKTIYYKNKRTLYYSKYFNRLCKKCGDTKKSQLRKLNCRDKKEKNLNFKRFCPTCNKELFYSTKSNRNQAEKKKLICRSCDNIKRNNIKPKTKKQKEILIRLCPCCNISITYKSKEGFRYSEKHKSLCSVCRNNIKKPKKQILKESLERVCPCCNKKLIYKTINHRNMAEKRKSLCSTCSVYYRTGERNNKYKIRNNSDYIRTCPSCNKLLQYKSIKQRNRFERLNKLCMSCSQRIAQKDIWTDDMKIKQSIRMRGNKNPCYGKKFICSDERRMINRIQKIERIKNINGFCYPNFNPKACDFMDNLNKKNEWRLQHARNGGEFHIKELGYFLDGYDLDRNIAFEYDEQHHYYKTGELKNKDLIKQTEIIKFLKCRFFRYNENKNILYEVV